MAWINNQQDWPDVYGLGPEAIFGVFGTTWYYRLDLPGVKEFVAAYQKQFPGMAIRVPGNVYHNGYMATRELLRCVEEAGTTNNIAVIKKLEGRKMSAADRLQHYDAWIDPVTHQCQQTIYMATLQRPAGREGRHLQDPVAGRAEGRGRHATPPAPASWRATRPRRATKPDRATRTRSARELGQGAATYGDADSCCFTSCRTWSTASRWGCCSR